MKTTSAEHGQNTEHVLPMFCACSFYGNSMNNLLPYCGLDDARISASEKDLPVCKTGQDSVELSNRNEIRKVSQGKLEILHFEAQ